MANRFKMNKKTNRSEGAEGQWKRQGNGERSRGRAQGGSQDQYQKMGRSGAGTPWERDYDRNSQKQYCRECGSSRDQYQKWGRIDANERGNSSDYENRDRSYGRNDMGRQSNWEEEGYGEGQGEYSRGQQDENYGSYQGAGRSGEETRWDRGYNRNEGYEDDEDYEDEEPGSSYIQYQRSRTGTDDWEGDNEYSYRRRGGNQEGRYRGEQNSRDNSESYQGISRREFLRRGR